MRTLWDEWKRAPPPVRRAALGVVAAFGLYLSSCVETMPLTGRRRFMFLSQRNERVMVRRAYLSILQHETVLPETHPMTLAVRRIGQQIVKQAAKTTIPPMDWEFYVLESKEPNAFCLPGGKVFVNSGLFKVLANEDALAAVLFHEAAHGLARHGAEKVSLNWLLNAIVWIVAPDYGYYFSDLLLKVAADLPYSRKLELEADSIGLRLMAQACYDPRAAIQMNAALGKLEKQRGGGAGAFKYFSTHPPSDERIAALRRDLLDALVIYEDADCGSLKRAYHQAFTPAAAVLVDAKEEDRKLGG